MLQDKGTKLKDISEKVKVVNQSYKDIESEKDKFNEFTKSYNTEKVAFINKQILKLKIKQFGLHLAKLFYFLSTIPWNRLT